MRAATLLIFAVFMSLGLSSCSKAPADKLIGTWTLDVDAMKASDDFKKAPEAQQKMMTEMFSKAKMEFTFTKDKVKMSMEMMGQKKDEEHGYKITKTEGDKLTLESEDKDGKKESIIAEFKGNTLVLGKGKEKFTLKKK